MRYVLVAMLFVAPGCSSDNFLPHKLRFDNLVSDSSILDQDNLTLAQLEGLKRDVRNRLGVIEVILAPSNVTKDSLNVSNEPMLTETLVHDLDLLIDHNNLLLEQKLSETDWRDKTCKAFIDSHTELSKDLRKTVSRRASGEYKQNNKRARLEQASHIFGEYGAFVAAGLEGGTFLTGFDYLCDVDDRDQWLGLISKVSTSASSYLSQMHGGPGIFDTDFLESLDRGIGTKKQNDTIKMVSVIALDIGLSVVLWQYGVVKVVAVAAKGVVHANKVRRAAQVVANGIETNKKIRTAAKVGTFMTVGLGISFLDNALLENPSMYEPDNGRTLWNDLIARTNYFLDLNVNSPAEYANYFQLLYEEYNNTRDALIAQHQDMLIQMEETWGSLELSLDGHIELLELLDQKIEDMT